MDRKVAISSLTTPCTNSPDSENLNAAILGAATSGSCSAQKNMTDWIFLRVQKDRRLPKTHKPCAHRREVVTWEGIDRVRFLSFKFSFTLRKFHWTDSFVYPRATKTTYWAAAFCRFHVNIIDSVQLACGFFYRSSHHFLQVSP